MKQLGYVRLTNIDKLYSSKVTVIYEKDKISPRTFNKGRCERQYGWAVLDKRHGQDRQALPLN